ncbi:hypothetical protein ACFXKR_34380 [Streptomyces violascens]|uniref:hypothetical protein n=1 Tax=Streptomyces violascens TaxID=67381 RepID=UPI003690405F
MIAASPAPDLARLPSSIVPLVQRTALHGGSLKRHEKSALWFSRNRKAGSALLQHNHVRPVIDRAWAPDYERIEGAIWHSKRTDQQLLDQTARERVAQKAAR